MLMSASNYIEAKSNSLVVLTWDLKVIDVDDLIKECKQYSCRRVIVAKAYDGNLRKFIDKGFDIFVYPRKRIVEFPREIVLAVIDKRELRVVYGVGEVKRDIIYERVSYGYGLETIRDCEKVYYVLGDREIVLRYVCRDEKALNNKPIVNVFIKKMSIGLRIEVNGQTYMVRDVLKMLGFKWDGERKIWYRDVENEMKIAPILDELREIANVNVR